ncbi:unnamed protein product [Clonostachys solani]|uniref:F-box domain-containing protein n=1 Tax=Clonostachys solani TaxID=160281 RepID=A0A9N9ZNW4_9HYPO|nr:unnamed protein product [Clonostachys solani]
MSAITVEAPACIFQDSLPLELQQDIIRSLDPIGLISLSQSSRHFRRVISPQRKHFAERLLIIECQPENKGPEIVSIDFFLRGCYADWILEDWDAHRWACTSCLKLLPHTRFNNHSILGLATRKPYEEWGTTVGTSSWVPSLHGTDWSKAARLERIKDDKIGKHGLLQVSDYERRFSGHARWKRRCMECQYKDRGWDLHRSRRVRYESCLDRWFPQLADVLISKRPPFPPRIIRPCRFNKTDEEWTMYVKRCPQCEKWQELRSFRFAGNRVNYPWSRAEDEYGKSQDGTSVKITGPILCNHCFEKEYGRESLAQALMNQFKGLLEDQTKEMALRLHLPPNSFSRYRMQKSVHGEELKQLLEEIPQCSLLDDEPADTLVPEDVAALRDFHGKFRRVWGQIEDEAERHRRTGTPIGETYDPHAGGLLLLRLMVWQTHFHEFEAHWHWLNACAAEIEQNTDLLVVWALQRDPESLKL